MEQNIKEKALSEAGTSEQSAQVKPQEDINIPNLIMQVLEPMTEIYGIVGRDLNKYFTVNITPSGLDVNEYQFSDDGDFRIQKKKRWVDVRLDSEYWGEEFVAKHLKRAAKKTNDLLETIRKEYGYAE